MVYGFKLQLPEGSFLHFFMPSVLVSDLTNGDEEKLRQPLKVHDVRIMENGFQFIFDKNEKLSVAFIRHKPEFFDEYLSLLVAQGVPLSLILDSNTVRATRGVILYCNWKTHRIAAKLEREIRAGMRTFEEVRTTHNEVFMVPSFQKFFTECFMTDTMPKAKKGKRRTHDPYIEALYALACRIYRETLRLSFEKACEAAVEQRPDLVPLSWREDPVGNLKREATRYWDKSAYSQLSLRQSRDK